MIQKKEKKEKRIKLILNQRQVNKNTKSNDIVLEKKIQIIYGHSISYKK